MADLLMFVNFFRTLLGDAEPAAYALAVVLVLMAGAGILSQLIQVGKSLGIVKDGQAGTWNRWLGIAGTLLLSIAGSLNASPDQIDAVYGIAPWFITNIVFILGFGILVLPPGTKAAYLLTKWYDGFTQASSGE